MERGPIGRYVTGDLGAASYRAFLPGPLPPSPPLELDRLLLPLVLAQRALTRMDATASALPNRAALIYSYLRREAVLSSQIEGSRSSLSDLLAFEAGEAPGVPIDDVREVSNYVQALEYGLERIADGAPIANALLRALHAILLSSQRGSAMHPGHFRHAQNWIGGSHPGNAEFVPPFPDDVAPCMRALELFVNANPSADGLPPLLRAGLAHLQFETIHPFFDGNGRIGRLLIMLILARADDLRYPALPLSLYLLRRRPVYYHMLNRVRHTGDWEAWLTFFLQGVRETAGDALTTMERLTELWDGDRARIGQSGARRANSARRVHNALCRHPVQSLTGIVAQTGLTFPTASAAMEHLVSLDIAREITGGRRNRLFAYHSAMDLLNQGAEVP